MSESEKQFDAVYYTRAAPPPLATLVYLALVFDRIHFPGVRVPMAFDPGELKAQIEKFKALPRSGEVDNTTHINLLIAALYYKELNKFCVFTGNASSDPTIPPIHPDAMKLAAEIEALYWGQPPPNFFPTITGIHVAGVPGAGEESVIFPGIWTYTANAVLYSRDQDLVLVNSDPTLPVPGIPGASPKSNAPMLSLILAMEAVKFALPKLRPMEPAAIADFREETANYVKPFRLAMLKLSKELNAMLTGSEDLAEVQKNARFLVETTVYPELKDLSRVIRDPSKRWYKRAVDLAKDAPELVSNFLSMPTHLAVAKAFAKAAVALADYRDDQLAAEKKKRNAMYYLLRVRGLAG